MDADSINNPAIINHHPSFIGAEEVETRIGVVSFIPIG
jgi:hypothetical protein